MINTLQILTHLPLMKVQMPENTKLILGNLISISTFEIWPSEKAINIIFMN